MQPAPTTSEESHPYSNRLVVYLDILGFKERIKDTRDDKEGNPCEPWRVNQISALMKAIDDYINAKTPKNRRSGKRLYDLQYHQFSDCVVISIEDPSPESFKWIFSLIKSLHRGMMDGLYLLRGGICMGKLLHDQNKVFGPALVDAYILESKCAVYPRVILSQEVISKIKALGEMSAMISLIEQDSDGFWYVDYIHSCTADIPGRWEEIMKFLNYAALFIHANRDAKPEVRQKYTWAAIKYNKTAGELRELAKTHLVLPSNIQKAALKLPGVNTD